MNDNKLESLKQQFEDIFPLLTILAKSLMRNNHLLLVVLHSEIQSFQSYWEKTVTIGFPHAKFLLSVTITSSTLRLIQFTVTSGNTDLLYIQQIAHSTVIRSTTNCFTCD